MAKIIPAESKLNCFSPVVIPKPKDYFKRMGFRQLPSSSKDGQVADFNRNPLADAERHNREYDSYLYDEYSRQMAEQQTKDSSSSSDSPVEEPKDA